MQLLQVVHVDGQLVQEHVAICVIFFDGHVTFGGHELVHAVVVDKLFRKYQFRQKFLLTFEYFI